MAELGEALAIPGTKNVVEQLQHLDNKQHYLDLFFGGPPTAGQQRVEGYTVDTIIDTIQERVKKSESFRNKILDWIKDQSKDWNKAKYEALKTQYTERIQAILATPNAADPVQMEKMQAFYALATHVMATCPDLQAIHDAENWEDFVQQLFATEEAKQWMRPHYEGLNPLQRQAKKKELMDACSPEILGEQLAGMKAALLSRAAFDVSSLANACAVHAKIKQITDLYAVRDEEGDIDPERSMAPPAEATLKRLIKGEVGLEVIRDHLDIAAIMNSFKRCLSLLRRALQNI